MAISNIKKAVKRIKIFQSVKLAQTLTLLSFWIINLFYIFLNLMPPFVRNIMFKIFLKKCGKNVMIDYGVMIRYPWLVEIGHNVAINRNCSFYPSLMKKCKIVIGNNVTIAYNVSFIAGSQDHRYKKLPDKGGEITVEDYAYIGCNVVILPGITVGEGSVIGAGAVVTKDVNPYTIIGGVPAKEICKREIYPE